MSLVQLNENTSKKPTRKTLPNFGSKTATPKTAPKTAPKRRICTKNGSKTAVSKKSILDLLNIQEKPDTTESIPPKKPAPKKSPLKKPAPKKPPLKKPPLKKPPLKKPPLKKPAPKRKAPAKKRIAGSKTAKPKAKYIWFDPSQEQTAIIQTIQNKQNVVVNAVAGSGKTTTVLWLAKTFPDKKIIQITYNSQLKTEVREKVESAELTNLEIHTYHSLAVKFYNRKAYTDDVMQTIIEHGTLPLFELPKIDIIVLDEVQDMTMLYYLLVQKFICDVNRNLLFLLLGDRSQAIYGFKGADHRFLTLGTSKIWQNNFKTIQLPLHTSYRVTKNIASFVNDLMIGEQRIVANKEGPKVTYINWNIWTVCDKIGPMLLELLGNKMILPGDIFVLSGSIKHGAPYKKLENLLVSKNIPCFVPMSDDSKLDRDVISGKVIFTTFHQSKGRERKVVIVYGFDNSYFTYYGKDCDQLVCPETLYVAATRASERLFVIKNSSETPLSFLKKKDIRQEDYIEYIDEEQQGTIVEFSDAGKPSSFSTSVTDFLKFIKEDTLVLLTPLVDQLFDVTAQPKQIITIPTKISTGNGMFEEIADLNGLVIPAILESRHNEGMTTLKKRIDYLATLGNFERDYPYLVKAIKKINVGGNKICDFLYLGNVYISVNEKLYFKLKQIGQYDWLTTKMVEACHKNMQKHMDIANLTYEIPICKNFNLFSPCVEFDSDYGRVTMSGRVDAIDGDTVWEFKCVDDLQIGHLLQVIVYAWLWGKFMVTEYGFKTFKIMNIRTAEVRTLGGNFALINDVFKLLLQNKYEKPAVDSDDIFIGKCIAQNAFKRHAQDDYSDDGDMIDIDALDFDDCNTQNTFGGHVQENYSDDDMIDIDALDFV